MGRRDALASLLGRGEGTNSLASEVARDIDWMKVRRAQYRLLRPPQDAHRGPDRGRAARLAQLLWFVAGVLLGLALLRGLAEGSRLLAVAIIMATAGLLAVTRDRPAR